MTSSELGVSDIDLKKGKEKEILVVQDQGLFTFDTADTYDGCFEAKKKDRVAKMHGAGVYTTAEGDIYSGIWDNDKLGANEDVQISYIDGSSYRGLFKDWCYYSRGKYFYPDGSLLEGDFIENCPVGKLRLTDPNGHVWLGKAEHGFGWLSPVNHFFEMLEKSRDPSKIRRSKKSDQDNKTELPSPPPPSKKSKKG